jgi:YVTN family beta-propeller protein
MKPRKSLLVTTSLLVMLLAATTVRAQSSNGDRVYTGDQTSNTVSVIDPATHKLLGVIRLGDPVPGALSPLYKARCLCTASAFHRIIERWP